MTANVDQEKLIAAATGTPTASAEERAFWGDLFQMYDVFIGKVSPWWSRQRDRELRQFWKDGLYGSALMTLAQSKIASMPMRIEARDKSISSHVSQAAELTVLMQTNSGFGEGWYQTMLRFSEDYLGQDNGAFMEILGPGEPDGPIKGAVFGLRHLDAGRCQRTGNPIYPVIYHGEDGHMYKMHFGRIFMMSQMPSADIKMRGVGLCSVSRSLRIIESLANTVNYKDEKMGARPLRQLLVGSGITGNEIIKAFAASEIMMDNLDMRGTSRTVALGSTSGDISIEKVELSNLDNFNEQAAFTFGSYLLALAWGLEFSEVVPQTSGRQDGIVSLQRARGMLPQQYVRAFEEQASIKLVPPHLKLILDYQDDQADKEHALINDILSRGYQRQIEAQITTPEVVQQSLHERGHLSDEQLVSMRLSRYVMPNGIPVATAYTDKRYSDLLTIDKKFLKIYDNDAEEAFRAINDNKLAVYEWMGASPSGRDSLRGRIALSALDWLEKEYNRINIANKTEPVAEEPGDNDGKPERNSNYNEGEPAKSKEGDYPNTDWFIENNQLVSRMSGW